MTRLMLRLACLCVFLAGLTPVFAQVLQTRPGAPPAAGSNVIPEGTKFIIRLNDKLDTAKLKSGKNFTAQLAEDLAAPSGAVIPRGKKVKGHVSSVERGMHARLLLSFDSIDTQHGSMPLVATVSGVPGEHAVKSPNGEGDIQRKGPSKDRMIETGAVGAGIGAVSGIMGGGSRGAAIGAAAGGALGVGAGLLTDRDLKLNKGQMLELRLDRPLQVPQH
jgi:hypothetical protein